MTLYLKIDYCKIVMQFKFDYDTMTPDFSSLNSEILKKQTENSAY